MISYFIESFEGKQVVGNYKSFIREKAKPVSILLKSFPIDELPSGNYSLVIEARNKNNDILINKKIFFQRSNPKVSPLLMTDDFQTSLSSFQHLQVCSNALTVFRTFSSTIERLTMLSGRT